MSSSATATATATGGGGDGLLAHITTRPVPAAASAAGGGGSYTGVFVVLGVIAALLVISCLVGQVCTKRHLRPRPRRDRVAYYDDDDMERGGIAKMEAAAPAPATTVTVTANASLPAPASVETRSAVV